MFDTTKTTLLLSDDVGYPGLLLDPAVIKFPNGDIACYIGAAPFPGQQDRPKIIAAWAQKPSSVESKGASLLPDRIYLYQNYPNPFNPATTIRFSLPRREHVTLKVFDVLGKEVATLVDDEKEPGTYSITFDPAKREHFSPGTLTSGVYFYQLRAGGSIQIKQMLVTK